METLSLLLAPIVSFVLTIIIIPVFRKIAQKVNLVDKPNARKVHTDMVPLIGGIVVWIASFFTLFTVNTDWSNLDQIRVLLIGSTIILLMGVIDDKMDIRASFKLVIQLLLAYYVFENGIRIDSFYGIFGIYTLPLILQYFITVIVIAGVINAFNLVDGIDGLAAGLAIVGLSVFAILAYITTNFFHLYLFLSLIGTLIAFLRFNFSKKMKIFMGDAGSLFIGFIFVVSAITMLNSAQNTSNFKYVLPAVFGVLALPVFDSIRVYRRRLKTGYSPFRADKSHIHHLVLLLGIKHKYASALVIAISIVIIALSVFFGSIIGVTISIFIVTILFILITSILGINKNIEEWKTKIKHFEDIDNL